MNYIQDAITRAVSYTNLIISWVRDFIISIQYNNFEILGKNPTGFWVHIYFGITQKTTIFPTEKGIGEWRRESSFYGFEMEHFMVF
jgi:hypothetical protein